VLLAVVVTPAGANLGGNRLLQPGGAVLLPGRPTAATPAAPCSGESSANVGGGDAAAAAAAVLPVLRPLQSWQQLGSGSVAVDPSSPALCVRRLPGVIRCDRAQRLGLAECCSRGGMVGTLADRLLPEIAYKVGRAPKYGA